MTAHPSERFIGLIGIYFVHWSSFELAVDIGITKIAGQSATDTVRATQGWNISQKINQLKKLVQHSSLNNKSEILDVLEKLPKSSVRNAMAHGYMRFGADKFIVIHRSKNAKVMRLEFTTAEFEQHLRMVTALAHQLTEHLNSTEIDAENHLWGVENA